MAGSDDEDEDFLALLDDYLEPPHDPSIAMSNVQIEPEEGEAYWRRK